MQLINSSNPGMSIHIQRCDHFFSKFRGLMLRKTLAVNEGIMLVSDPPGILNTSIHMFFMRFDIAVIWLDENQMVVDKTLARAWRPYYTSKKPARYILEIHSSRINDFNIGDRVEFSHA